MVNVVTQPYRRPKDSREDNYLVTLAREFDLLSAIKSAGATSRVNVKDFLKAHPSGLARIWAVRTSGPGIRAAKKMEVGDVVVFYGENEIYAFGEIASKVYWENNNFAWPSGKNWDYIYSLNNFTEIPEGSRPIYQELRKIFNKLDVQAVGVRSLSELGISKREFLQFILHEAKHSEKRSTGAKASHVPKRDIALLQPRIGERFRDRKAIWQEYGGQSRQGIITFPGDKTLNVFSGEDGPYPDYRNQDTGVIEYRGQGLRGEQKLTSGNKSLENARLSKAPIRYWFKPSGGTLSFEKWVIVADRESIAEEDMDGQLVQRILWYLVPVPSEDQSTWAEDVAKMPILDLPKSLIPGKIDDSSTFADRYKDLAGNTPQEPAGTVTTSAPRTNFKRRRKVRNMVLERSNNKCEFDGCNGMAPDVKSTGEAILEVDHINALGEGGMDHPSNMTALCPNCHAAKTHGSKKNHMIKRLKSIVLEKESRILK